MSNKKIIIYFVYLLLIILLCSCMVRYQNIFPNTTSKFIVERIEINNTKGTNLYFVRPIETKQLNIRTTWFVDSIGKFNAGDTLSFKHYK